MLHALALRIAAALPGRCEVCRAWPAQPVCDACVGGFAQPHARCLRCAGRVAEGITVCGQCIRMPPPLDACHAAVPYAYPWSGLIASYKFREQPGWAGLFATLMRSAPWVEPALDAAQLVLPMPLSRERLAQRGFNQALEIARRLAPAKLESALLLRLRDTPAQASLDRAGRLSNVQGAFAVEPLRAGRMAGLPVVIVDDVMTSGASLHSAALALRKAGASRVTALVLARTD